MALDRRFVVPQVAALTGIYDRKGWQLGGLRSRAVGSEYGEMALRPSEKRHLAPVSAPILTIFSGFFCGLAHPGANWRECGSKKRWNEFRSTM
jgi:hypothetical protein